MRAVHPTVDVHVAIDIIEDTFLSPDILIASVTLSITIAHVISPVHRCAHDSFRLVLFPSIDLLLTAWV